MNTRTMSKLRWLWVAAVLVFTCGAFSQTAPFEKVFRAGTDAQRSGQLTEAEQNFAQAIKLQPSFAEAHFNLGLVFEQEGRHDEAINCLSRALALKPHLRGAHLFLGIAEYRK